MLTLAKWGFIFGLFLVGLQANPKIRNLYGIVHINNEPAYIDTKGFHLFADNWFLSESPDTNEFLKKHQSPQVLSWGVNTLTIPRNFKLPLTIENNWQLMYKVDNNIGYLSADDGRNWHPLKLKILKNSRRKIDNRRTFLSQISISCEYFSGVYDIIEKKPIGLK